MTRHRPVTAAVSTATASIPLALTLALVGCPSNQPSANPQPSTGTSQALTVTGYQLASTNFPQLAAPAGSAVDLAVYQTMSDGSTSSLPASATVSWSGASGTITATDSQPASPAIATASTTPYALFVSNPLRPEHVSDLAGLLFLLAPGTGTSQSVNVTATVSGIGNSGAIATGSVTILAAPTGNAANGQLIFTSTYANGGANCASCHGMTGEGGPANPDADGKYSLPWTNLEPNAATSSASEYGYQAPGLNAAVVNGSPNLAADPAWNAQILALAARADMDNYGVALRAPMPDWQSIPIQPGGQFRNLTAQDFADVYAWLVTQKQ